MAGKKDVAQQPQTHPDRQRFIQDGDSSGQASQARHAKQLKQKAKKRKEMADQEPVWSDKKIGEQKKRIRDLSRALEHKEKMPMTLRQVKERELEAVRSDLEEALRNKEKNRLIKQYHMVRFFERQKATRALKHAQKAAAAEPAGSTRREELKAKVHEAEVNLNYTMFSPLLQKYVGIFGKEGGGAGFKSANWYLVEAAMATNTLKDLRNRMSDGDRQALDRASGIEKYNNLVDRARQNTKSKPKTKTEPSRGKDEGVAEDSDDSEGNGDGAKLGGFFEMG